MNRLLINCRVVECFTESQDGAQYDSNDSPGHSAQYCSYTLMDCHSGSIVSTIVVDKREVNLIFPNMEKVGLQRSLTVLAGTLNLTELVTDAHTQIAAFLRKICHGLTVKKENNYFTFSMVNVLYPTMSFSFVLFFF